MLGRAFRAVRDPQLTKWANGADYPSATSLAGQRVNASSAMSLLTFYGCVQFITQTVSAMPVSMYDETGGFPTAVKGPGWIDRPNPDTNRQGFASQFLASLAIDGNAFVIPMYGSTGQVVEAWVVDPGRVQLDRSRGTTRVLIDGEVYTGPMIHFPWVLLPGQIRGVNPVGAARQSLGMGLAAVEADSKLFAQGLMIPGVISFPGVPTPDQQEQIREGWSRHYGGASNAHRPGMLFGGATYQQVSISPRDAQFLESRQFSSVEIISLLFMLPADVFSINSAGSSLTYQNIEQRWSEIIRRLMPWMTRLEQLYTMLAPAPMYAKLNASSYLRADTKSRYETHAIGITNGFLTVNEARALEDLAPLPHGDEPVDVTPGDESNPADGPDSGDTVDTPDMGDMPAA